MSHKAAKFRLAESSADEVRAVSWNTSWERLLGFVHGHTFKFHTEANTTNNEARKDRLLK